MEYNQDKFISKVKNTYKTLPHSIILLGDSGSGHEYVCEQLSNEYKLFLYNITDMITTEYINQICLCSDPSMYIIDLNKISDKEQNILLKVFEEPTPFTYIVLYGESLYNVIDTIKNRGKILNLDKYTTDYLKGLITNTEYTETILKSCTTPGQVEIANHTDISALNTLCENLVTRIGNANIANTLTISNKINFSDQYSKFDLRLFTSMLCQTLIKYNRFDMYDLLNKFSKVINYMNDKRSYFDNLLIKLWKLDRSSK